MRNSTPFDRIEDTPEFYTAAVVSESQILEQARSILQQRRLSQLTLCSPAATQEFVIGKLGALEREVFAVIYLDPQQIPRLRRTIPRHHQLCECASA